MKEQNLKKKEKIRPRPHVLYPAPIGDHFSEESRFSMSQKYGMLNDGGYGANVMAPYPAQPPAYGAAQPPPPSPQLQPQQPQQQQQGPPPSNATILVQVGPFRAIHSNILLLESFADIQTE